MNQGTEDATEHEWITIKEAALLTKVSVAAVRRWIRLGKIQKFTAENNYHIQLNKAEVLSFAAWRRTQRGPRVTEVDPAALPAEDHASG